MSEQKLLSKLGEILKNIVKTNDFNINVEKRSDWFRNLHIIYLCPKDGNPASMTALSKKGIWKVVMRPVYFLNEWYLKVYLVDFSDEEKECKELGFNPEYMYNTKKMSSFEDWLSTLIFEGINSPPK